MANSEKFQSTPGNALDLIAAELKNSFGIGLIDMCRKNKQGGGVIIAYKV